MSEIRGYQVKRIPAKIAKQYITMHHYSHGCMNCPSPCYALFEGGEIIGVLVFATPCSENVRCSVFGEGHENEVIELHRLHILDCTPKNTESWFISKCIKLLKQDKPRVKAVISFADETAGHKGIIYRASNFYFIGKTSPTTFYVDESGRLRHPRQCGTNITKEKALEMGWTPVKRMAKNRYLTFVYNSKTERKRLIKACQYDLLNSKWCKSCGKEISIENYYNVCDECLEKETKND